MYKVGPVLSKRLLEKGEKKLDLAIDVHVLPMPCSVQDR